MARVQPHHQEIVDEPIGGISQAHAADCQRMAKFTRDPASKATWNRMAERWQRCAETFNRQSAAAKPVQRHRRGTPDMEHYREAG
jgi:hypothetical protein